MSNISFSEQGGKRSAAVVGRPGLYSWLWLGLLSFGFFSVQVMAASGGADKKPSIKSNAEQGEKDNQSDKNKDNYFAIINGERIPLDEFLYTFRRGVKEKFYHGKVSREKVESFKNEVADKLVSKVLLVNEARRRGLKADNKAIDKRLSEIDENFKQSKNKQEREAWEKDRVKTLEVIRQRMEADALTNLLYEKIKQVRQLSENELQAYYKDNKDKFTAPEKWDVSLILLSVDPSSASDVWQAAIEEAQTLVEKLREGASFEEMARIHSGDESASRGGNMGYLHIGMLSEPAQKVLNIMDVGQISEPVVLLKGVAIFRLNAIQKARLNEFDKVRQAANDLLVREKGDLAWKDLIASLRSSATVQFSKVIESELNAVLDTAKKK